MWRWIRWCDTCGQREVNGRGGLCARCRADLELAIEELERGLS